MEGRCAKRCVVFSDDGPLCSLARQHPGVVPEGVAHFRIGSFARNSGRRIDRNLSPGTLLFVGFECGRQRTREVVSLCVAPSNQIEMGR